MTDSLTAWAIDAGPLGLFLLAFLAATLLPFSSEAGLVGGLAAGIPTASAVVACSLGNCLACLVNYGLGAWGRDSAAYRVAGVLSVLSGWFITAAAAFSLAALFTVRRSTYTRRTSRRDQTTLFSGSAS